MEGGAAASNYEDGGGGGGGERSEGKEVKRGRSADCCADDDQPFRCFICLQLVHKPVVNACGHMFCFWCIHLAMSTDTESYCPLCRRAYMHFPRVCEQLHHVLLKALPVAYRRRCREVHFEEPFSSPQFDDGLDFGASSSGPPLESSSSSASEKSEALPEGREEEEKGEKEDIALRAADESGAGAVDAEKRCEAATVSGSLLSWGVELDDATPSSSSPSLKISDVLCSACKKLLYRPAVVNCGHVFCEECLAGAASDGATLKCFTCGSVHPGGHPLVCLELHQYLEQKFPREYEERRRELAAAELPESQKARTSSKSEAQAVDAGCKVRKSLTPRPLRWMHMRIGCDGCGMFPLLGRRFRCVDCPFPGYDLCWHCYKNGTSLLGRFNQQHTQAHDVCEIPSPYDSVVADLAEGNKSMEAYFGIVGYFA